MRKISAMFTTEHKYEIDENDPAFEKVSDADLIALVKKMLFIDLFNSTTEDDILPLIQVTILD